LDYRAAALRDIIDRVGLSHLKDWRKRPGLQAAYRLTVLYVEGQARNSVATLQTPMQGECILEVVYEGLFQHKPIRHPIPDGRYDAFFAALRQAGFDDLRDQSISMLGARTLWLLERLVGSFYKSVILSPHRAEKPYTLIVNAVDAYLPESIREVLP
jgi:hypothetical protein